MVVATPLRKIKAVPGSIGKPAGGWSTRSARAMSRQSTSSFQADRKASRLILNSGDKENLVIHTCLFVLCNLAVPAGGHSGERQHLGCVSSEVPLYHNGLQASRLKHVPTAIGKPFWRIHQ